MLLLGGCANEPAASVSFGEMSHLGMLVAIEPDGTESSEGVPRMKRTVASKVLSSMAFQRITGLRADPARLLELD
jgi:hypothetical protein